MSPPKPERLRRWLVPAALLAVMPKCALCMAGYFGLATALGLGGPEICGAPVNGFAHPRLWLSAAGFATGGICLAARRFSRSAHAPASARARTHRPQAASNQTDDATRSIASALLSTSASVVAHDDTLMRMAVRPCQTVTPAQHVPSS
jgi:hypothetical protein